MNLTKSEILGNVNYKNEQKVGHNTYKYQEIETNYECIRYCKTDIITWFGSGKIILNSDGYKTVTTKKKMNEFQNIVHVYQKNHTWYCSWNDGSIEDVEYFDGMVVDKNGLQSVAPY